jgi:hypothetical protein
LSVQNFSVIRQIKVYKTQPLIPCPSRLEVRIVIAKLKKYKSLGSDQIPAEVIKAGCETLLSAIHKRIDSILIRKYCLIRRRNLLLYQLKKGVIKVDAIIMGYHCYQLDTNFIEYRTLKV